MTQDRSKEGLLNFLSWLGEKGYLPANTAVSRKIVAKKVFADLSADEAADVTQLDLDSIMARFENRNRGKYGADSLRTYHSRLKNSIRDFSRYADDPMSYQPKKPSNLTGRAKSKALDAPLIKPVRSEVASLTRSAFEDDLNVLPIRLREDLTVKVVGLPFDLSSAEAKKVANIILAYVSE